MTKARTLWEWSRVWSPENLYFQNPMEYFFRVYFLYLLCSKRIYLRKRSRYWDLV